MFEALLLFTANVLFSFLQPGTIPFLIFFLISVMICAPGLYAMFGGPLYLPTPKQRIDTMMALAKPTYGERVYDLGCGDGRLVFAAAARGAVATGIELSLPTYLVAKLRSIRHPRSSILFCDFWKFDYRDADVICCYLLKSVMAKFKDEIWSTLKPGTRVVSHTFRLPGIEPAQEKNSVFLYIR